MCLTFWSLAVCSVSKVYVPDCHYHKENALPHERAFIYIYFFLQTYASTDPVTKLLRSH
jgi:hypothetical protein